MLWVLLMYLDVTIWWVYDCVGAKQSFYLITIAPSTRRDTTTGRGAMAPMNLGSFGPPLFILWVYNVRYTAGVVAPQVVQINYGKTAPYIHLGGGVAYW